mmetsp:Transcript_14079/g.44313  ORF Transcript_14079/g.44313 Transcript_14079/m.44313 type:complete len:213 (+) Transcript_14079:652-1290(+)
MLARALVSGRASRMSSLASGPPVRRAAWMMTSSVMLRERPTPVLGCEPRRRTAPLVGHVHAKTGQRPFARKVAASATSMSPRRAGTTHCSGYEGQTSKPSLTAEIRHPAEPHRSHGPSKRRQASETTAPPPVVALGCGCWLRSEKKSIVDDESEATQDEPVPAFDPAAADMDDDKSACGESVSTVGSPRNSSRTRRSQPVQGGRFSSTPRRR